MSELHNFNPNITFSKTEPTSPILCDLLDNFVKHMFEETSEIDYGWKYINEEKNNIRYSDMHSNIYEFGSDVLISLITLAEEERISDTAIKEILFNSMYLELTSGKGDENFLFQVKLPEEIDVTKELNSLKGTVNGQQTDNVYKTVCDAISNKKVIEYAQDHIDHLLIDNNTATLELATPMFWSAYVDENKLKDKLLKQLKLSEQEFERITGVG